ncbi:MAG: hypothetical protein RL747_371 [Bacteroidota bacterium]|jgi:hypothetical protein
MKNDVFSIEERIVQLEIQNNRDKHELIAVFKDVLDEIQPVSIFKHAVSRVLSLPITRNVLMNVGLKIMTAFLVRKLKKS